MLTAPSAATRVAAVIGDPVHHSLSPALHNAAFAALGLDWVYVAFPVRAGRAAAAVAAMRTLDLAGLSVTMPHKAAVVGGLDRLGPTAARLGVVNTISWAATPDGSELVGDSTDGAGFLDALRGDDGFDPTGRRCLILGAGGAARLGLPGPGRGRGGIGPGGRPAAPTPPPAARPWRERPAKHSARPDSRTRYRTVIWSSTPPPWAWRAGTGCRSGWIPPSWVTISSSPTSSTPRPPPRWWRRAEPEGRRAANGLGPLIHQAARQVAIWTGRPAPIDVMSAAALSALGHGAR